jgi:HD superfamily phosphohydrolase YqeK
MALEMGRIYGEDPEKIRLAALFHDYCKDSSKENNALAHAGEAADILKNEYGVTDEDVLNAVRYHTTGRKDMSRLELIIFLADTLETGRTYAGADRLRSLAYTDLYACGLAVLTELKVYLDQNGFEMGRDGDEAIAWLREARTEGTSNEKNI